MKTLYASAWCFAHGINAYSFENLRAVFQANHVVPPQTWFAHAPVYPPFTLALLAPSAAVSMTVAVYLNVILSAVLFAWALGSLLRYASRHFSLPWYALMAAVGPCAASPMLSFAFGVGNVSIAVSALARLAFLHRTSRHPWLCAAALAIGILLKPHLAIWIAFGMFCLLDAAARRIASRAIGIVALFSLGIGGVLAASGRLSLQFGGFLQMLHAENSSGASMSAGSREVLPIFSQITSSSLIVGFWTTNTYIIAMVTILMLATMLTILVRHIRHVRTERAALLAIAAWSAFGLIATYHRNADTLILFLLIPWLFEHIAKRSLTWQPWVVSTMLLSMSVGPPLTDMAAWAATDPHDALRTFLMLRQAALTAVILTLAVIAALGHENAPRTLHEGHLESVTSRRRTETSFAAQALS